MALDKNTIEEVKARMDVVEVLSDFISLKRKGQNLWACCPFHEEKTPSFSVSPAKGIYKCFGCGKSGDAITFIMDHEGVSYPEAIRYLAKRYGIEIQEEEKTPEQVQAQNERESLYIVLNYAKEYFTDLLWNHQQGRGIGLSYFKERGFTEPVIKNFELGFSLDTWQGLHDAALKKGFSKEQLEKAGLILVKDEGRKVYDRFRGRVTFPIQNISGRVIGFGARILTKDKNQPKYLNSPETLVYEKSKVLYGLYQAKAAIRQQEKCYLVEGYTDVISLHMVEVANVVASSGTSLTEEQIQLIKRYTNNITVLYDGDTAGLKASMRGVDMILAADMNVRVVAFPEGEDPDSYSQKLGQQAFQTYLKEKEQDFITFKARLYAQESAQDPVSQAQTVKEIVASIARVPDPIKRTVFVAATSKELAMPEDVLLAEMNKIIATEIQQRRRKEKQAQQQPGGNAAPPSGLDAEMLLQGAEQEALQAPPTQQELMRSQEQETLRVLLSYGHINMAHDHDYPLAQYLLNELDEVAFTTPIFVRILHILKQQLGKGQVPTLRFWLDQEDQDIKRIVIDLTEGRYEVSENWRKMYQIIVPKEQDLLNDVAFHTAMRLKHRVVVQNIEQVMEKLKTAQTPDQQDTLLQEIMDLKNLEKEIAQMLGNVLR